MPQSDRIPFPEMREAILSAEDLLTLIEDLRAHARVTEVLCKAARRQRANHGQVTPELAVDQLLSGDASAVQFRYWYDNSEWTDTLMKAQEAIRLVRCRHCSDDGARRAT
jgi:hypothetical protein